MEPGADNRDERKQIVEAKLLELGWEIEDIRSIYFYPRSNPANPELTTAAWTRIWKEVEPELQEKRTKRMRSEAIQAYDKFRAGEPAGQWRTLPATDDILKMRPFAELLARDVAEPAVTAADYASAAERTRVLSAAWTSKQKKRLSEGVILPSFTGDGSIMAVAGIEQADLAVATFVCLSKTPLCLTLEETINEAKFPRTILPLIGVTEALGHERLHSGTPIFECLRYSRCFDTPASSPRIEFSPVGSSAAVSLLALLSLDPATSRPLDVDKLNARFRCAHCIRLGTREGHLVMDWRRCISHHIASASNQNHPPQPAWVLLNAAETQAALGDQHKTSDHGGDSRQTWLCRRCLGEYTVNGHVSFVKNHIQRDHDIATPVQEDDFACLGANHCPMPRMTFYNSGLTKCICLRCPAPKRTRHFIREGVRSHLKAVHKFDVPLEGEDFRGVTEA